MSGRCKGKKVCIRDSPAKVTSAPELEAKARPLHVSKVLYRAPSTVRRSTGHWQHDGLAASCRRPTQLVQFGFGQTPGPRIHGAFPAGSPAPVRSRDSWEGGHHQCPASPSQSTSGPWWPNAVNPPTSIFSFRHKRGVYALFFSRYCLNLLFPLFLRFRCIND